jgi:hypothetical protein
MGAPKLSWWLLVKKLLGSAGGVSSIAAPPSLTSVLLGLEAPCNVFKLAVSFVIILVLSACLCKVLSFPTQEGCFDLIFLIFLWLCFITLWREE